MTKQRLHSQAGFTLIEVGIAALVLVVGFIGMIRAMTFTAGLMDHARRQTVATQILTHEIEQLRLASWSEIGALPTTSAWVSTTAYSKGSIVTYNGGSFVCATANTGSIPTQSNFWSANMAWSASTAYVKSEVVSSGGTWYRCIASCVAGTATSDTAYWAAYSGPIANTGITDGATYSVTRAASTLVSGALIEVTVKVTWSVTSSRRNADNTPLIFTYSRVNSTFYGKNGLNLTYQRS